MNEFGQWLKRELKKRDMTQNDLAEMMGVCRAAVSAVMNRIKIPKESTAIKYAEAIGADISTYNPNLCTEKVKKGNEDFMDWLACAVVCESEWEQNPAFYREVICRKLVRLGILKIEDDCYVLPKQEEVTA